MPSTITEFGSGAHRLDICVALSGAPTTIGECARKLGLHQGVIYRPFRSMYREGLIECDGEPARHTKYWLRPDLHDQLLDEIGGRGDPNSLSAGQILFTLEPKRFLDLATALIEQELSACVLWAAELDGGGKFLLALESEQTSPTAHARLRTAIEGAGGQCQSTRVLRTLSGEDWRRMLASARDSGG